MRFRLDPLAPPVEAPAPPPAAPATPAPPPPKAPAAAKAPGKRLPLAAVIGVVVLVLVTGTGATLYAMDVGPFAYPDRYLLEKEEVPPSLRLTSLPVEVREELGVTENPGKVRDDKLDGFRQGAIEPEEGWIETVTPRGQYVPVLIMALRFADADAASDWAADSAAEGCQGGTILKDGKVIVAVGGQGRGTETYVAEVVKALRAKSDLSKVC